MPCRVCAEPGCMSTQKDSTIGRKVGPTSSCYEHWTGFLGWSKWYQLVAIKHDSVLCPIDCTSHTFVIACQHHYEPQRHQQIPVPHTVLCTKSQLRVQYIIFIAVYFFDVLVIAVYLPDVPFIVLYLSDVLFVATYFFKLVSLISHD